MADIKLDRECAVEILDILAEMPYRQVENVFKYLAQCVTSHDLEAKGDIQIPDTKIIVPDGHTGSQK